MAKTSKRKKWSAKVNQTSNALDLDHGVFAKTDPHEIALSLKNSASHSRRRKGTPYQSAMSMLNFYINRGGRNLSESKKIRWKKQRKNCVKYFTVRNK